jgi:hypothetical protein
MVRHIIAVLVGLFIATAALADVPFIGRWKFNPDKSELSDMKFTFTEVAPGEIKQSDATGESTFKFDGKDYPDHLGHTSAWKQIDSTTWESVNKVSGKITSTDRFKLSPDGRTLTITTTHEGVHKRVPETVVGSRVSGGPGLPGTWQAKSQQADETWEFSANGADGMKIDFGDGSTCAAKFDGKDYPMVGPSVPARTTWSLKRTGERSFDMTQKRNGKVLVINSFVLSEDGKTLTSTTLVGPSGPQPGKLKAVFDRQ